MSDRLDKGLRRRLNATPGYGGDSPIDAVTAPRLFDQPLLRSVKRKKRDCFATGAANSFSAAI
jgi:hypothetical protein